MNNVVKDAEEFKKSLDTYQEITDKKFQSLELKLKKEKEIRKQGRQINWEKFKRLKATGEYAILVYDKIITRIIDDHSHSSKRGNMNTVYQSS